MDWSGLEPTIARIQAAMQYPIIQVGKATVTLWSVVYVLVLLWLLFFVTRRVQH